ncbi:hypothetical protein G6F24_016591 [Rhizopus arrhizus]|nr:hypothetical protein G6F24_016591 [Rhizopus arrhizus]
MVLLQRYLHVLAHGQRGEQGAVLEQHAGVALDVQAAFGIVGTCVAAQHFDLAFVGRAQAEDRAHQHRLAGTGAADHAQDLAFFQGQRYAVHRHQRAAAAGEFDADVFDVQQGHDVLSAAWG